MATKFLKVKESEALVRDVTSHAIINNSEREYSAYVKQKEAFRQRRMEIERQADEINNLKDDLSDIKILLKQILDKQR